MLISDDYRVLQEQLHIDKPKTYGVSGQQWSKKVLDLALAFKCESILDYGCGKKTLHTALLDTNYGPEGRNPWSNGGFQNYDPCIEGLDTPPDPADLVVCGDVLEHVEPDCLEDVLDDLARLAKKIFFGVVATGPAAKHFPDGSNLHIIQEPMVWWLERLGPPRFYYPGIKDRGDEFVYIGYSSELAATMTQGDEKDA